MNRVEALNNRYAAAASLKANGVEIVAFGDPDGARLNAATRRLIRVFTEDGPGVWDDLVASTRALRWRLMTQPQPIASNDAVRSAAAAALQQVSRLRGAVSNDRLLDELSAAITLVQTTDPALGPGLLRLIERYGAAGPVVIAASRFAEAGLAGWLADHQARVLTASDLERHQLDASAAIAVGPPRFFRSSLVTSPVTRKVAFILPAWFKDRTVPRSALSTFAEGAVRIGASVRTEGDASEPVVSDDGSTSDIVEDFLPQPSWGTRRSEERPPRSDEVEARKLLLSGQLAMWLDDGERIRSLDPRQPAGERVTYVEVAAVTPGTVLLLRQGATEREALYQAALQRLGARGPAADATQQAWKGVLRKWVDMMGRPAIAEHLRTLGIKAADRARAWTEPNFVRPHSDQDFERLLEWLKIPTQPTLSHATLLRAAIYQAAAEVRAQLEQAVSDADMSVLTRDGHLRLDMRAAGFRGMMATRVVAISPFAEIVSRREARVPFTDRGNSWLE